MGHPFGLKPSLNKNGKIIWKHGAAGLMDKPRKGTPLKNFETLYKIAREPAMLDIAFSDETSIKAEEGVYFKLLSKVTKQTDGK